MYYTMLLFQFSEAKLKKQCPRVQNFPDYLNTLQKNIKDILKILAKLHHAGL